MTPEEAITLIIERQDMVLERDLMNAALELVDYIIDHCDGPVVAAGLKARERVRMACDVCGKTDCEHAAVRRAVGQVAKRSET